MTDGDRQDERWGTATDDELAERVRGGDISAFDELYRRHEATARRTARWMMHNAHAADDVVADVFASMLAAFRNGRGPTEHVVGYLNTAVRNRCIAHQRLAGRARPTDADDLDLQLAATGPAGSAAETSATSQLVAVAFATLNARWQRALWMSEVEGRSAKEIGAELGLPAAAVPALTYRARRAFAEAYLEQHAECVASDGCRAIADKLPRYVRESASRRDVQKVEAHLEGCESCRRTVAEMADLNLSLRTLPAPPAAVAAAGAGGLVAWLATAAAIGAVVVLPAVALRSDTAAGRSTNEQPTLAIPHEASPVATDPSVADAEQGPAGSSIPAAGSDPAATGTPDAPAPTADPAVPVEPASSVTGAPDPSASTPAGPDGSAPTGPPTALPAISVPIDVPVPGVPVQLDVAAGADGVSVSAGAGGASVDVAAGAGGVAVDAGAGLPAGLGGVDAGVSVGGGGAHVTVVPPTVPLVGTVPPVTVDVTLPPAVAIVIDGLLGSLFGTP